MTQPAARRKHTLDLRVPLRPAADVTELYEWAERFTCDTIDWYLKKKYRKARWSRGLRAGAASLAALGGTVPVAALAAGYPVLGNWGFVLLALAAGCLAYDRFFGYSTAWMRYMSTVIALRSHLTDFQLSWIKLTNAGTPADQLVEHVHKFVTLVNEAIRRETESWSNEFNSQFTDMESNLTRSRRDVRNNNG
ncbi:MAG TPA: SLATT domain-containing protein [Actinophytocola sp.]|uniref:SLATT domain-containing protein n=1 Tax=Actinophytocola sp. TaxID=1872138 RepID=UPI002E0762E8|nr:SLATT domain-containing protein [Actinophytocola sp.]